MQLKNHPFLYVSLTLNALVVFPLTILLLIVKPERMVEVYGPDSEARRILASIYFAIGVASVAAMFRRGDNMINMAFPIFYLQIIYKIMTAFTVGFPNPVVISNVAISAFHMMTMFLVVQQQKANQEGSVEEEKEHPQEAT
ncbi:unnamed protein product [Cylindrotheca closterium]|uniref:Uncharacterized protein n=1 Tax=Cylindrotheca closterium TaxID=2856 RepID=A0AAD2FQF4_9STRA|nr:unnamed protein product [Cylindrotheca closterium]